MLTKTSVIEFLQSYVSYYTTLIKEIEDIKKVVKLFNGKVINKRFVDTLETHNPNLWVSYVKDEQFHSLKIYSRSVPYDINTIVYVYDCETDIFNGNRLDAKKFIKYLNNTQMAFNQKITKIKQDMATGFDKLKQWNILAEQMNNLFFSMSDVFKQKVHNQFQRIHR